MAATTIKNRQVEVTTDFDINSQKLTNVATPVADTDGANKGFVLNVAAGIRDPKDSCRVATTADITLSGTQIIDGVSLDVDDRALVKDQTLPEDNGIYVVAAGAWARATDADTDAEVTSGMSTYISEGTANAGRTYVLSTADPITLGTTALTFVHTGGAVETHVTREVPAGTINGVNDTFTLANTPVAGSESVYANGVLQNVGAGNDYTISGDTITFEDPPATGYTILVNYRY